MFCRRFSDENEQSRALHAHAESHEANPLCYSQSPGGMQSFLKIITEPKSEENTEIKKWSVSSGDVSRLSATREEFNRLKESDEVLV